MKSNNPFFRVIALIGLALGLSAGCEPISPEDKAFFDEQERERSRREASLRAASAAVADEDVIQNVKQVNNPDGEGTMEEWINQQLIAMKGQILFPKWSTRRRGSNIQEVSFNFIHVNDNNQMRRFSYVWDVDVLDMTVGTPNLLELGEIDSPDQTLANQHLRRVAEFEKQLQ